MKFQISRWSAGGLIGVIAGSSAMAFLQGVDAPLLDSIQRGKWQLRPVTGVSSTVPVTQICLGNPASLIQMQHGSANCDKYVVRSTPNTVTVSYSCKGQGQGLTTVRMESSRLLQIQSQGIHNNAPFSFSAEARYAGVC
jgi:hypothetical protein